MKKINILIIALLMLNNTGNSQITKNNWLVGGTGSFSRAKTTFQDHERFSTQIDIKPRVGYFFMDRFAGGLFGNYTFGSTKANNINASHNYLGIGPFVRYYFLPIDNRTNLLLEANSSYNWAKSNQISDYSSFITYEVLAGPVVFLNSSVGLEILLGYSGHKENKVDTKNNGIKLNIGIQFYLEREK